MDKSTCLKCHHKNLPKFSVDNKMIISFDRISFDILKILYIKINLQNWQKAE